MQSGVENMRRHVEGKLTEDEVDGAGSGRTLNTPTPGGLLAALKRQCDRSDPTVVLTNTPEWSRRRSESNKRIRATSGSTHRSRSKRPRPSQVHHPGNTVRPPGAVTARVIESSFGRPPRAESLPGVSGLDFLHEAILDNNRVHIDDRHLDISGFAFADDDGHFV